MTHRQQKKRNFGEWLSARIAELPSTKTAFATALGVSYPALRAWCDGDQLPRPDNLTRIANALGLPRESVVQAISEQAHDSTASNRRPEAPSGASEDSGVSRTPSTCLKGTAGIKDHRADTPEVIDLERRAGGGGGVKTAAPFTQTEPALPVCSQAATSKNPKGRMQCGPLTVRPD